MKTVYILQLRPDDKSEWGKRIHFRTRRERNDEGAAARIIGGLRTWSYEEKKTAAEIEELFA